jgi:WD40 repeat protein
MVRTAHFDPTSRHIVGASLDGVAWLWDATSPYRRWSSPPISDECGVSTSLEPDRRFITVGCGDHATQVWDTARDELLAELPSVTPMEGDFASAFPAASAAGDRAAIARGNVVEIYALPGGQLLRAVEHGAPVSTVAFAPAGHDLVTGGSDGSLLITRDGREPIALRGFGAGIDSASILPDGRAVATDARKRLRVYDAASNAVLADLEVTDRIGLLRASPDNRHLISIPSSTIPSSAGKAGSPVLWDLERYRVVAPLDGHTGRVFAARWVAGQILTAGSDSTVRLWDPETGQLRRIYVGASSQFSDATISPDGSMVVAAGSDGAAWFWEVTGRSLWRLPAHASRVIGVHFEGDDLVTRGFAGDVSRWKFPSARQVLAVALTK